ncbi:retron-type reverse transcriptase [Pseudoduganella flava]|uniref:RNA-dependent DNA polymerase n=1 Tax=Pseudoduganella flava TaxID=871742 RepID=A0A562PVM7_9BURK|nr:RNA-directed DNA polymerase [Pseudoduganella flava]QGZ39577.1 RNA-dependent DNA polymerase [Pseudoduganella flava]TWI48474.1 retron-type reverse transcriptase [Pseudoduganella flava]
MSAAKHFAQQFTVENLRSVYEDYIALTSAIGVDRLSRNLFEQTVLREIELINKKAADGSYKFSQYKEKLISKGANKYPRVISIPTYRDRITLRALCNVLKSTFKEDLDVKLPQHTVSELRKALASGEYTHFIKLDVTNFYPSIDHDVLTKILKRKIRKAEIHHLIRVAIESPTVAYPDRSKAKETKGVPQGLSISNILAEIYLSKFDAWASKMEHVKYFRYVDDVLILTNGDPEALFDAVSTYLLNGYHLNVHPLHTVGKSMVGKVTDHFNFLGYDFKNTLASVKLDSVRRLESSLAKIFTTYKYRRATATANPDPVARKLLLERARKIFTWRLNLRITGCLFDEVRRGWVFYFSQIDDKAVSQLHGLDKTINVLCKRFAFEPIKGELKSFVRSFHEAKRSNLTHKYIPNFDTSSIDEQRALLELYGMDNVGSLTEVQVNRAFKRRIRRETSELEQDIEGGSRG